MSNIPKGKDMKFYFRKEETEDCGEFFSSNFVGVEMSPEECIALSDFLLKTAEDMKTYDDFGHRHFNNNLDPDSDFVIHKSKE